METPAPLPAFESQAKWAKAEDWVKFRTTITELFMRHSLPNVIRIMREEHQFHATNKMFTTHIYQKWGLKKTRPDGQGKKTNKVQKRKAPEPTINPDRVEAHLRHVAEEEEGSIVSHDSYETHSVASTQRPVPSDALVGRQSAPSIASTVSIPRVPPAWVDFLNLPRADVEPIPRIEDEGASWRVSSSPFEEVRTTESQAEYEPSMVSADSDPSPQSWQMVVRSESPGTAAGSTRSRGSSTKSRASRSSRSGASHSSSTRRTPTASTPSGSQLTTSITSSGKSSRPRMVIPAASLRHLVSPDGLLLPERSMFAARHYISSTFSTGLWTLSQSTDTSLLNQQSVKLDQWYNDFNPGLDFIYSGKTQQAFRIFQQCFSATKTIIEPEDPRLVIYLFQSALRFLFYDTLGRNLSRTFLRYVAELCKVVFSTEHPLYIILTQTAQMDHFEFAQNIRALMDCYFDHLEPFFDPSSDAFSFVSDLRGVTVDIMEACGVIGMYEVKPIMDRLVARAERLGHSTLHLKLGHANMYQRHRLYIEARTILSEVCSSEEAQRNPYELSYANILLMVTLRRMGDLDGVIRTGRDFIEYLTNPPFGADVNEFSKTMFESQAQSTMVVILGKLEVALRESGRTEEAAQVHGRIDTVMNTDYGIQEVDDPQAAVEALGR